MASSIGAEAGRKTNPHFSCHSRHGWQESELPAEKLRSRETETELELQMEMEMESEAACLPLDWLASLSLPNVGMMMRLHLLLTLDVHFRANSSRSAVPELVSVSV